LAQIGLKIAIRNRLVECRLDLRSRALGNGISAPPDTAVSASAYKPYNGATQRRDGRANKCAGTAEESKGKASAKSARRSYRCTPKCAHRCLSADTNRPVDLPPDGRPNRDDADSPE
jgi:hypothetical protein